MGADAPREDSDADLDALSEIDFADRATVWRSN
ncbi:hypothetical protein EV193_106406 [Herbihabitans rhizosphaerae]|uniref:Uncharacterized protein n=1 Tax=Herbihabitans rhizosphaerae TaxID=1872711 RepID=A0A4Q7KKL1_9PSEU|nr:hypothetical protein EV193_106406 [Herbihabitans rhizosphaerae]